MDKKYFFELKKRFDFDLFKVINSKELKRGKNDNKEN